MNLLIDFYIGRADMLLKDAEEIRREAGRHLEAESLDEFDRLLAKNNKLVSKAEKCTVKANELLAKREARR